MQRVLITASAQTRFFSLSAAERRRGGAFRHWPTDGGLAGSEHPLPRPLSRSCVAGEGRENRQHDEWKFQFALPPAFFSPSAAERRRGLGRGGASRQWPTDEGLAGFEHPLPRPLSRSCVAGEGRENRQHGEWKFQFALPPAFFSPSAAERRRGLGRGGAFLFFDGRSSSRARFLWILNNCSWVRREVAIVVACTINRINAGPVVKSIPYFQQHAIAVRPPLSIPESQLKNSLFSQACGPSGVVRHLPWNSMLEPVEFDGQASRRAIEIEEILEHGMLSAELESCEAARSKSLPQLFFLASCIAPQSPCLPRPLHGRQFTNGSSRRRENFSRDIIWRRGSEHPLPRPLSRSCVAGEGRGNSRYDNRNNQFGLLTPLFSLSCSCSCVVRNLNLFRQ